MGLHELKPAKGSVKKNKRLGRGEGSGSGGTASKGHKGAQSRSGYKTRPGFEGGQMPLYRRVPKRGFKNINRVEYTAINLDTLQHLADVHKMTKVDIEGLRAMGHISKTELVKVLGRGELKAKLDVQVHKISEKARAAIEAAGGNITLI